MEAAAAQPPVRHRARWRIVALALLLIVAALAAAVSWLASTTRGIGAVIAIVNRLVPARIEATGAQGALTREFGFERLRVIVNGTEVDLRDLRARLRDYGLRPLRFEFESLSARRLDVQVMPSGTKTGPPESIASTVPVSTQRLAVGEFNLTVGTPILSLRAIDAEVALGPEGYRVTGARFESGAQQFTLDGELGGRKPFAFAAHGSAGATLQARPVQAQWRTDGTLLDFTLAAQLSGDDVRGTAQARISSFDTPALKSLQADVDGIDLHAWAARLPTTRLKVQADLRPDEKLTTLSGPVRASNRDAGTIDAGRIPLRAAHGDIVLTRQGLHASGLALELTRGRASGSFAVQFDRADWQADLRLDGVDPAAIHARARPLLLDGTVRARRERDAIVVLADVRNRAKPVVNANLDLRVATDRVDVRRADLALGSGRAALSGSIGLTGARQISAKGTIDRIDPGLLVAGVDALLSGDFDASAQLQPRPSGQVRFELRDSRAFGRPLTGRGRVQLDPAQQLEVDAQLAVRSARVTAQGGLGAPGRTLAVALDAPALDELLPALHGSLKGEATLSGAWNAPAFDARAIASDLLFGEHRVQIAQAVANYSGGADGRLSLQAGLANHRYRDNAALSLRSATLVAEGPLSQQAIALRGTTDTGHGAVFVAQGGLSDRAWRGTLREANIGAPLDLRLLAPGPLTASADGFDLGPLQFALVGARFDDVRVASGGAGLRTSGSFSGLRPADLIARDPATSAVLIRAATPLDPLTLRGQWQFQLGAQADGSLTIERSGGDLYAGASAQTGLKLREVRLDAALKANRLEAHAVIAGERSGTLDARMNAFVERAPAAGWRLAQQRPWQFDASVDLPSLAWINTILGERVRANVRLDGRLAGKIAIAGTPADPQASGTLSGDALRVAWVEQGMRLENGRLRARLEGDTVVLDELRFAGPPRVRPEDKRAAERLDFAREGSVTATGRLRVRDLDGVIQVAAERLPLLQRPDRWIIASGGANIEVSLKRVQLNGAFAAIAGYVDFSRSELPTLSSDVVVLRTREEPVARAPRVALGFDVGIDLGDAFYVRGGGLNTRVEGAVRLRGGRGAVTATGALEAKDGIYEGFGQRLAIERGRVNFQGPPENPGLDVLAIRRGLPVEVGVTITRTAANPLIRLYSDPPMSDYETLSWLVLGRPAEQSSRTDNVALAQAAASLLSGNGQGIPGQLARALGIDEITLRAADARDTGSLLPRRSVAGALRGDTSIAPTATSEIITIGKRVGEAVTISYEQALAGTASIVQLSYRLSQRLSLVARAGTENALDLVYSIAFD
jgi:translocation and assembly module TamB